MNNDPCRYCQFNGTQACPLTNCGLFPHCPQGLKIKRTRFFNVKPPSIWLALKKPNRTSCGCHWKYIDGDWKDSLMECGK